MVAIHNMLNFIRTLVTKHAYLSKQDYEECVGECCLAVIIASRKFDPTRVTSDQTELRFYYSVILNCIRQFARDNLLKGPVLEGYNSLDNVECPTPPPDYSDLIESEMLRLLTPLERAIVIYHFGLLSADPLDWQEIGKLLGVSRRTIYRIWTRACAKLKQSNVLEEICTT